MRLKRMRLLIAASALALVITGCKKQDAPPATGQPQGPAPSGQTTGAAPTPAVPTTGRTTAAPGPETPTTTPDPETNGQETTGQGGTEPAEVPVPEAPAPVVVHRLEKPKMPAMPSDNILSVIHAAEVGCKANDSLCDKRDALATKLAEDIDATRELLEKGTDQQKAAIRAALLRARHPDADALLVTGVVGPSGALDDAVIAHAVALRATAAVQPLGQHLAKSVGLEAIKAIDALGALGGDNAKALLTKALDDPRLAPYHGEVCRSLARVMAMDRFDTITEIGNRLDATARQARGCRGAEAAFRMMRSGNQPILNIDGNQHTVTGLFLWQSESNPLRADLVVSTALDATCDNPGEALVTLSVPLDRNTDPQLNIGLVPSLVYRGDDLGTDGAYLFRFEALEMTVGSTARGSFHISHGGDAPPRIIVSGHFQATWCGVHK